MNIEFELDKEKLKKSLFEVFKYNFKRGIFSYSIFSLGLGYVFSVNQIGELNWNKFLIYSPIFFIAINSILILIPLFITLIRLKKIKKYIHYSISNNGIAILNPETHKKKEYLWERVKSIVQLQTFEVLILKNRQYIPVPENLLSIEEKKEFESRIQNLSKQQKGIPNLIYYISFIPNFGLFAGIVFIILGIVNKTKKSIYWGIFGILFTPLFWFVFISIYENSNVRKENNVAFSKMQLNDLVKDLTYYKSKNGAYPDSLGQLKNQNKFFDDNDRAVLEFKPWNKPKQQKIYYQKQNDSTYILKSKGIDGVLNTEDDIEPDL